MSGSPDETSKLWTQDLQVHWPKSWRFHSAQDVLLEIFNPQVFTVDNDALFIRYAENQDLRISEYGMHLRILTRELSDPKITEVYNQVLRVIEPKNLRGVSATFSHVLSIEKDYDVARQIYARVFYGSWLLQRQIQDFALLWDERYDQNTASHFEGGVVESDELLDRIARAADMSAETLRRRTPAWMKVRMPKVALFMQSAFISMKTREGDVGQGEVFTWKKWRDHASDLFNEFCSQEGGGELE